MNYKDFLSDDLFVYWRIHPIKELNAFWENFIRKNEEHRKAFNKAIEVFEQIRDEQDSLQTTDTSLLQVLKNRIKKEKKRRLRIIFTSSAAAVLLLTILSTLFMLYEKPGNMTQQLSSIGEVMDNSNIQLFTGSDMLEIDNNSTLNLSEKKHSAVIQNPFAKKEIDLNDNRTNTLVVPYGKRSTLILADGSKIYLNSGTKMEFPTSFSGKKREIRVEGEIFIDVKKNKTPFVIHTPHSQILVYGTSFNVSSYAEDRRESVVLVNGSVEVRSENSTLLLNPSEMAEIENGAILRRKVDVSDYTGWTNGYMQFNKSPLNEVLKKIGRYYNVEFRYARDLDMNNQTCSGKLFLSESLDDVLQAFSKMTYLQCDKQDDTTISIRK